MLRILIPFVFLLAGLGGGVAAGLMLGGGDASDGVDEAALEAEASPAEAEEGDDDAEAAEETEENAPGPNADREYVRLNNQFIVPIVRHGTVRSMAVLSLTVEVAPGQNEAVYQREPRLRDAFLRVLFAHANAGGFDGSFTASEAMLPLREALREAAVGVLGEIASDVLIVDIVRQDA